MAALLSTLNTTGICGTRHTTDWSVWHAPWNGTAGVCGTLHGTTGVCGTPHCTAGMRGTRYDADWPWPM